VKLISYLGNFGPSFSTESHLSRTLESMGHKVLRLQEDKASLSQVVDAANIGDLFMWTRTPGFIKFNGYQMLEQIKVPSFSYHLDLYVGIQRHGNLDTDPFWRTDYVFSADGDSAAQKVFEEKGINHIWMMPGVVKDECYIADVPVDKDIAFVGSWNGYHPDWPYRVQLVKWLKSTFGNKFTAYPPLGQPSIREDALNRLYASTKIIVGDAFCPGFNKPNYFSDRLFETTGRGGFLIHPRIEGIPLKDKEHIVMYDYKDFEGLKKTIDYYLEHDEEREAIRRAGFEEVKANHNYHVRMQAILDYIDREEQ